MRVVDPSFRILTDLEPLAGEQMLERIERAGRTCYKSEDRITPGSARKFVEMVIARGHLSVIEHESVSVSIICDRGVSHEIVRHRLASYSQESTRYCNYGKAKFGEEIAVINPRPHIDGPAYDAWFNAMEAAERWYFQMLNQGATPQMARSVLPNSLKTEIVMTCNLREWLHFFTLRTSNAAHPQMRQLARPMCEAFTQLVPVIFDQVGW